MTPRALLILCALLSGCHLVFGHSPARDARSDGARELGRDALALHHELPPPADPCLRAGCIECEPLANPDCIPCSVPDCDDLPAPRDPSPVCNQVLFFDDFCDGTLASWEPHSFDGEVNPAGVLLMRDQGKEGAYTRWLATKQAPAGALVEARIHAVSPAESFRVTLSVDGATTHGLPASSYRWCQLIYESSVLSLSSKFVHAEAAQEQSDAIPYATNGLVLQSWLGGGEHRCLVRYPDGTTTANAVPTNGQQLTGKVLSIGFFSDGTKPG